MKRNSGRGPNATAEGDRMNEHEVQGREDGEDSPLQEVPSLGEMIDAKVLQSLLDRFYKLVGMTCVIVDKEGRALASVGWQEICLSFHRAQPESLALCNHTHDSLFVGTPLTTRKLYQCPNGLWNMAAPVYVAERRVGTLSIGQFLLEGTPVDVEAFRARARGLGFPEADYMAAVAQVPIRSEEEVDAALAFLVEGTSLLSSLAQTRLDLSRALADKESQEQTLRSILRAAPTGIGVAVNRVMTAANHTLCTLLGYERDELIGNSTRLIYPSADEFERVGREHYAAVFASGMDVMETNFRRKDGSVIDVLLSSAPLDRRDPSAGITFTVLDLTEHNRKERERQRRLHMEHILGQVSSHFAGVSAKDLEVRIDEALGALGQAAGADRTYLFLIDDKGETTLVNTNEWCAPGVEPQKHTLQDLPAAAFSWWMENLRHDEPILIANVSELSEEADMERKALERQGIRSLAVVPVWHDNALIGFVGFDVVNTLRQWSLQDVDFLRTAAAVLGNAIGRIRGLEQSRRLEARLLEVERIESVGRLAGGVAHDFNNMLQTILGCVEMALVDTPEGTPVSDCLHEIRHAAERSADLTRQLLAFARRQTISPRSLDVNHKVSDLLGMLDRLTGEEIELSFLPAENLHRVNMDPVQVDQILTNLVLNARDAIIGAGKVVIETANVTLTVDDCASHSDHLPGSYVKLSVSDNGHGMDHTTLDRAFDPFFTTKKVGHGTGLGLSTVYGIATQNGGFVDAQSTPGHGATFAVYMPWETVNAEAKDDGVADLETPPRGTETVLLVEDEKTILDLVRRQLTRLGYQVLHCDSPLEALELAAAEPSPIHLLVTDVIMPGMDGRTLATRLSASRPQMRCLYVSGYTADVIAKRGVLDEGVHFLGKPFDHATLAKKVREVLDLPG